MLHDARPLRMGPRNALLAAILAGVALSASGQTMTDKARALFTAYYEWQLKERPTYATAVGDHRYDDRLPDVSESAIARRKGDLVGFARQLTEIDRNALSGQDRLSYDVLARLLEYDRRSSAVFSEPDALGADQWLDITAYRGPHIGFGSLPALVRVSRFESVADYDNYLKRLDAVPKWLDDLERGLERAMARGWLPPRAVLARVPEQIDALLVTDLATNPVYAPFKRFPERVGAAERERLATAARSALADKVLPAFQKLKAFYVSRYLPACGETFRAARQPSWGKAYAAAVASQTTTSLTPKEIHEVGLKEVARIGAEMDAVVKRIGFKGTRAEFAKWLETAPEMHYTSAAEMLT